MNTETTKVFTGEVIFFSNQKGYGFLSRSDGEKDIFCHFSAIAMAGYKSLKEGQKVEYEIEKGKSGPQAANVKVIK